MVMMEELVDRAETAGITATGSAPGAGVTNCASRLLQLARTGRFHGSVPIVVCGWLGFQAR